MPLKWFDVRLLRVHSKVPFKGNHCAINLALMDVLVISILTGTGRKPLSEKGTYLNEIPGINS